MTAVVAAFIAVAHVVLRVGLVVMCWHLVRVTWAVRRLHREPALPQTDLEAPFPFVTVQLPLYNEFHVVEKVLRAAAALDWPSDRLEIQVLDDSTDETRDVVDRVVAALRRDGGPSIAVIRRTARVGYKAGALAHGLETARGELIAMFDADCTPTPDFLRRTVPRLLADDRVGMVQGRWTFSNRNHSLLTRIQALLLESLMLVEQVVRSRTNQPFQFNGTAGVWRRSCIADAGGWSDGSIAEDLELSFRALLRGWRFLQLADVEVLTELPETMTAFRVQQRRWVRGNFEVLRQLGGTIATAARPLSYRLAMLVHISRRLIMPLLALQTILLPLTTFNVVHPPLEFSLASSEALLVLSACALGLFLVCGHVMAGQRARSAILLVPAVIGLSFGLSLSYSHSVLAGLLRRKAEFVSTPKHGGGLQTIGPRYTAPFDRWCLIEIAAAACHTAFTVLAIREQLWAQASFFAFLAVSFGAVGFASLRRGQRISSPDATPTFPARPD